MQPLRERRRTRPSHPPDDAYAPQHKPSSSLPAHQRLQFIHVLILLQTLVIVVLTIALFAVSTRVVQNNKHTSAVVPSPTVSTTYDCYVTIYAYDRPRHLLNLLRDLAREADAASLTIGVNVLDDNSYSCQYPPIKRNVFNPSTNPNSDDSLLSELLVRVPLPSSLPCAASHRFSDVERFMHQRGWRLYVSKYRHARRRYWHLIHLAHTLLRPINTRFLLFLPDDDRLAHNFFPSVFARWNDIHDDRKLTLMLHVEATREHVPVWTDLKPRSIGDGLTRIGWVESGNFLCTPDLLRFLNWSFPVIPVRRWLDNPPISSGVGATLSQLIHDAHRRMYRTDLSFVAHVGVTLSKMNAEFRKANEAALLTKYFADGEKAYHALLEKAFTVTASIASHWVREASLHSAVLSLAPQVDHINVYLNEYDAVPSYLQTSYISVLRSADTSANGVIGDVGKFFWCNNLSTEFHLTADDDIIYPPDYVDKLYNFWRSYRSPVIVGVHGIRIKHNSLNPPSRGRGLGYYGSRDVWMAVEAVRKPVTVHIIGTGTMLYRPRDIGPISIEQTFPKPNMADVWFGLLAQRLALPMVIIPREAGWIREVPGTFEDSIYKRSTRKRHSDRPQTEAAKSIPKWLLHHPVSVR